MLRRTQSLNMVLLDSSQLRNGSFEEFVFSQSSQKSDVGDWLPATAPKERYARRLLLALRSSEQAAYGYCTEPRPDVSSEASAAVSEDNSFESAEEDEGQVKQEDPSTPAPTAADEQDASTVVAAKSTAMLTHGPRRQGLPQRRNNDECQVFVRNIPTEATEEDIFNVFYCYEPINVKVIRNKRFADVRGFVTFHCAKTAQRAAKCKINIMGRNLYLSLAQGTHRTKI
eukprot:GEMP01064894.1.p1 GENE.GEMP01064894.1~~GEMP01064894.1.p1  ORF type:complete len:228 (+),score=48.17 GEMP01064894.1:154-837(+)